MKNKLLGLLEVRKIIALAMVALFIALALMGVVNPTLIEYTITTVIAFYFAKSTALDKPDKGDK